jgi:hypothetical protein
MEDKDFLFISCSIQILSICVMLLALVWLKCLLSEAIKMNIPMMVVHIIVLLYFFTFTIFDLYYFLKLERLKEEGHSKEYNKFRKNFSKYDDLFSFGLFVCELIIAEMLRRLSKRINID